MFRIGIVMAAMVLMGVFTNQVPCFVLSRR